MKIFFHDLDDGYLKYVTVIDGKKRSRAIEKLYDGYSSPLRKKELLDRFDDICRKHKHWVDKFIFCNPVQIFVELYTIGDGKADFNQIDENNRFYQEAKEIEWDR